MDRKLIFIRHGKLDLPYASHDTMPFSVLHDLATRKLDPPSNKSFFDARVAYFQSLLDKFHFSSIFRSPSRRCSSLETHIRPLLSPIISTHILQELQEIYFDLYKMFRSDNEVSLHDITERLFDNLLNNQKGVEPLRQVLQRINTVVVHTAPESGNVLILTHDYLMRVIAAYLPRSHNTPALSLEALHSIPKFNYFDGFVVSTDNSIEYLRTL